MPHSFDPFQKRNALEFYSFFQPAIEAMSQIPPLNARGTGKTTRLAKVTIPKAVDKYSTDGVAVTSFTRAAAKKIGSRGILIDDGCVGTLHSLCFRALGFPTLTDQ